MEEPALLLKSQDINTLKLPLADRWTENETSFDSSIDWSCLSLTAFEGLPTIITPETNVYLVRYFSIPLNGTEPSQWAKVDGISFMNTRTASDGLNLKKSLRQIQHLLVDPGAATIGLRNKSGHCPVGWFQKIFDGSLPFSEVGSDGSSLRGAERMPDPPEFSKFIELNRSLSLWGHLVFYY